MGAPRSTPVEIINKLNTEINAALVAPKIKTRLADLGGTTLPGSSADFGKLIAEETEKWAKVVEFATSRQSETSAVSRSSLTPRSANTNPATAG